MLSRMQEQKKYSPTLGDTNHVAVPPITKSRATI